MRCLKRATHVTLDFQQFAYISLETRSRGYMTDTEFANEIDKRGLWGCHSLRIETYRPDEEL